jgi:hypothetical protein
MYDDVFGVTCQGPTRLNLSAGAKLYPHASMPWAPPDLRIARIEMQQYARSVATWSWSFVRYLNNLVDLIGRIGSGLIIVRHSHSTI